MLKAQKSPLRQLLESHGSKQKIVFQLDARHEKKAWKMEDKMWHTCFMMRQYIIL